MASSLTLSSDLIGVAVEDDPAIRSDLPPRPPRLDDFIPADDREDGLFTVTNRDGLGDSSILGEEDVDFNFSSPCIT